MNGRRDGDGAGARRADGPVILGALLVLFVSVLPFAFFYVGNSDELVQLGRLAAYLGIYLLVNLTIYAGGVALAGRQRAGQVAFSVAAVAVAFWNYARIRWILLPVLGHRGNAFYVLIVWIPFALAGAALAWQLGRFRWAREWAVLATGLFCVVTLLPSLVGSDPPPGLPALTTPNLKTIEDRPDVFHFVLDGYGGTPALDQVLGHDNRPFLDELRSRSFEVSDDAYSSYPDTRTSLSTVLSMEYASTPDRRIASNDILRGDSRVFGAFRRMGYQIVMGEPGVAEWATCGDQIDLCVGPLAPSKFQLGQLERSLLDPTPLGPLGIAPTDPNREWLEEWNEPERVVDEALELGANTGEPVFTYIHLLRPHPPYLFDADCDYRDSDTRDLDVRGWGKADQYGDDYLDGVECLNSQLLSAIDAIQAANPEAVILIHGDHGSGFKIDSDMPASSWSDEALLERYSIVSAMHTPEQCPSFVGRALAPPNFYRLILGCIEGESIPYLDFAAFGRGYTDGPEEEITDRLEAAAGPIEALSEGPG